MQRAFDENEDNFLSREEFTTALVKMNIEEVYSQEDKDFVSKFNSNPKLKYQILDVQVI